jgi:hypothetical protein
MLRSMILENTIVKEAEKKVFERILVEAKMAGS